MVNFMTSQEILVSISIILSIIFTVLLLINIKYKKLKFIKNHIIASIILTIPSLVLAFVTLFIKGNGDLKELFYKIAAFAVPIMLFCVIATYQGYIYLKSLSKKIDEADKNAENRI